MKKHERFSNWFNDKYFEWIVQQGKPMTKKSFAEYIKVDPTLLSKWFAGQQLPGNENVIKIGNRLGKEIYDLLEWERPE